MRQRVFPAGKASSVRDSQLRVVPRGLPILRLSYPQRKPPSSGTAEYVRAMVPCPSQEQARAVHRTPQAPSLGVGGTGFESPGIILPPGTLTPALTRS